MVKKIGLVVASLIFTTIVALNFEIVNQNHESLNPSLELLVQSAQADGECGVAQGSCIPGSLVE